ncbi:MAG: histidine phosphatase family protein [Clostridia bacterium]|nr:histidine phosphatase family protein [Clostridia bacterium]
METINIFDNPQHYRDIILQKKGLLKYDINKNRGKSLICVFFTAYCGVGCPFCFFHSPSAKIGIKEEELEFHFNEEALEKFVKFANDANVGYLQISGGGEPFLEKDAIIKCIEEVNADRIILVTSGSWAFDRKKAEEYLNDLYNASLKRKKDARITVRVSISEYHNIKLKNKPLVNLLNIFNEKYRNEKNFTLQLKTFENDNALIDGLNEFFPNYKLEIVEDNGSDDKDHIKTIPWKYSLILDSGYNVVVGKSRIFNSNLRPDFSNIEEIKKSEEIYDKDMLLSQKNNSSIVYNSNGENGLDWIVEYNGNVCTWQNRIQDNLLNIYEDNYKEALESTYSDVLTYSYIDKGSIYRSKIVNEVSPRSVSLMKSVNIRDYAGTQLFYDEKIRLYYTIRVIQDYIKENLINENVIDTLPIELKYAINKSNDELKKYYNNSTYSIAIQELKSPISEYELRDLLELIKLGHYDISKKDVEDLVEYYNFISDEKIDGLEQVESNKEMDVERRLTKRMMKRKVLKVYSKIKFFYLCRHGETNWNVEKRIKGQLENIETNFTERGLQQIYRLRDFVEKHGIQIIFSSDLIRTRETAKTLDQFLNLPLYYLKNFRGLNMGVFQGKTMQEFLSNEDVKDCFKNFDLKIPGGESINDLIDRFMKGIDIIKSNYNYNKIAIISHGAAISNIKAFISKQPYEDVDYCVIKSDENGYEVIDFGKYI